MNILCISPFFAPFSNPEAFCGAKHISALLEHGVDATVLWSSNFNGKSTGNPDDSRLWSPLRAVSVDVPVPVQRPRIRALPLALRYRTRFYSAWIRDAVSKAVELHSRAPFDLVYSRSLPMAAHVAGYWCTRKLNLPWVANINDPWDSHHSPTWQEGSRTHRLWQHNSDYWLAKTLQGASLITFPSKELAIHHGVNPQSRTGVDIVPHIGYAVSNAGSAGIDPPFNILHAGRLSNEEPGRSPHSLLHALADFLARTPSARTCTQFTLVGTKDAAMRALSVELGLEHVVRFAGRVNYERSLREISAAAVCVLVEADMDRGIFLPSKLVDYIAAHKPTLALSPSSGVVANLAVRGGIIRVDPSDPVAIAKAIGDLYEDFRRGNLDTRRPPDDLVEEFRPRTVAQKFLSAMAQLGGPVGWKAKRLLDANKFSESTGARRSDVALHNGIPS
jgi:glycosyltransferase involved in cell wall biosynthesis